MNSSTQNITSAICQLLPGVYFVDSLSVNERFVLHKKEQAIVIDQTNNECVTLFVHGKTIITHISNCIF